MASKPTSISITPGSIYYNSSGDVCITFSVSLDVACKYFRYGLGEGVWYSYNFSTATKKFSVILTSAKHSVLKTKKLFDIKFQASTVNHDNNADKFTADAVKTTFQIDTRDIKVSNVKLVTTSSRTGKLTFDWTGPTLSSDSSALYSYSLISDFHTSVEKSLLFPVAVGNAVSTTLSVSNSCNLYYDSNNVRYTLHMYNCDFVDLRPNAVTDALLADTSRPVVTNVKLTVASPTLVDISFNISHSCRWRIIGSDGSILYPEALYVGPCKCSTTVLVDAKQGAANLGSLSIQLQRENWTSWSTFGPYTYDNRTPQHTVSMKQIYADIALLSLETLPSSETGYDSVWSCVVYDNTTSESTKLVSTNAYQALYNLTVVPGHNYSVYVQLVRSDNQALTYSEWIGFTISQLRGVYRRVNDKTLGPKWKLVQPYIRTNSQGEGWDSVSPRICTQSVTGTKVWKY